MAFTYYISYHRRLLYKTEAHERETCIERMTFDEQDYINPVKMTFEGVKHRL